MRGCIHQHCYRVLSAHLTAWFLSLYLLASVQSENIDKGRILNDWSRFGHNDVSPDTFKMNY